MRLILKSFLWTIPNSFLIIADKMVYGKKAPVSIDGMQQAFLI